MDFRFSEQLVPKLVVLEECGSTNSELVARASRGGEPEFSTLVTTNQTRGRGRLGRTWVAPPGQTLAISVLVTPVVPSGEPLGLDHYGWLPLIAGMAMTRAVATLVPGDDHRVTLKWPNDVLIDGRKVAGLLAELLAGGGGVVLGAGLNLTIAEGDLPTPTSTSLILNGANPNKAGTHGLDDLALADTALGDTVLTDLALAAYLRELRQLYGEFLRDGGQRSIRTQLTAMCSTIGRRVRVELPGGTELVGTAVGIDESGRLCVRTASDGRLQAVAAGDVTHVR